MANLLELRIMALLLPSCLSTLSSALLLLFLLLTTTIPLTTFALPQQKANPSIVSDAYALQSLSAFLKPNPSNTAARQPNPTQQQQQQQPTGTNNNALANPSVAHCATTPPWLPHAAALNKEECGPVLEEMYREKVLHGGGEQYEFLSRGASAQPSTRLEKERVPLRWEVFGRESLWIYHFPSFPLTLIPPMSAAAPVILLKRRLVGRFSSPSYVLTLLAELIQWARRAMCTGGCDVGSFHAPGASWKSVQKSISAYGCEYLAGNCRNCEID